MSKEKLMEMEVSDLQAMLNDANVSDDVKVLVQEVLNEKSAQA